MPICANPQATSSTDGRTLLFFSAAIGAVDLIAQLLLLRNADVNHRCSGGLTALHFAAAHGEHESVRLLLAHGARPDLRDNNNATPIDHALRGVPGVCLPGKGHADCHALLRKHIIR